MLLKIRYIFSFIFFSLLFISCNATTYEGDKNALAEACKYHILISSDYSKWTPKAYAYFTYSLDWFNTFDHSLCNMTNNIKDSDKDIDVLGYWDSIYLYCANINSIYKNPKSIEKQYFSSICNQGISFGKNHIGALGGEIQSENNVSYFFLYYLWKIEKSEILILPKYVAEYSSIEKSDISNISYFSTTSFTKIGDIENFPIAYIQTKPFNFNEIDISKTFLSTKYNLNGLGCDVLRFKSNLIEEDWNYEVLKKYVEEHPEYTLSELINMEFYKQ